MADKVVSGIGRELRYFEYKLRKKQHTSKKDKRNKNGNPSGELAWSDAPTSDEFRTPTSEEFTKAMPSNKGEEELQVQVALAMSREEENERSRQTQSDDLRLKLALEESKKDELPKPTAQPSLLDLSMSAPKPTPSAQSPGFGGAGVYGSTATNDPWGGATAAPAPAAPVTFDPFASNAPPAVTSAPYPTATSGSAWSIPQTIAPVAPVASQDPWGGAQKINPPPNSFAPTQPNPWGTAPAQNAFPQQNGSTWGNPDPFASTQPVPTYDPFLGTTAPTPQSQPNGFGMTAPLASTAQERPVDPFGSNAASLPAQSNAFGMPAQTTFPTQAPVSDPFGMSGSSETFTAPPFDPLKDFDQLHISATNGHREPEPVMLQNDISSGNSVAKDIFPLGQVLEPTSVNASSAATTQSAMHAMPRKKETDLFLGENSNLVNLDSGWKTYQVPYCSKPLGTQAHNPFQQSGPTKTLNEMKYTKQPGFP